MIFRPSPVAIVDASGGSIFAKMKGGGPLQ